MTHSIPLRRAPQAERAQLAAVLAAGLVLRLVLAVATEGYPYDINCFFAWGLRMAEVGPAAFYAQDYFCDYPPAYLYVLGLVGKLMQLLGVGYTQATAKLLLVLVPALADCGIAAALYRTASQNHGHRLGLRFAAAAAFCPVLLYDTAVWKQIDGPFALLVLLCFLLLEQGSLMSAALVYGLALAVKPQALLAGPVLAVCFLRPLFTAKNNDARITALKDGVVGAVLAVLPPVALGLPFWGVSGLWDGLVAKYVTTTGSYPYATINGFNLMAALGGNWAGQDTAVVLAGVSVCTWKQLGSVGILLVTLFTALLAVKAHQNGRFSPLLLAAAYTVGVFTFSHRMHERYLIFAVVLLAAAAAKFGSSKLFLLAGGLSLTSLLNLAVVYTNVNGEDQFLTSAMNTLMVRLTGAAETALCLVLLAAVWDLCTGQAVTPFELAAPEGLPGGERIPPRQVPGYARLRSGDSPAGEPATAPAGLRDDSERGAARLTGSAPAAGDLPAEDGLPRSGFALPRNDKGEAAASPAGGSAKRDRTPSPASGPQPPWTKRETLFLLGLTAAVALASYLYLGDTTAPQTCVDANGGSSFQYTVATTEPAAEVWVYPGVSSYNNGSLTLTDEQGTVLLELPLNHSNPFTWQVCSLPAYQGRLTVTVTDGQVFELSLRGADGGKLALSALDGTTLDGAMCQLFDEAELVPQTISQLNRFYFDEIYHARTGYESLHGMNIYETTHPPLGKDFIALGIALFGMTAFGWRFFGTLFGVLMVPVLYLLARRLTRSRKWAGFCALLLSVDFMRFSQSRIATIDSYSVFFILLGAYCMVWYCQSVPEKGVRGSLLPMALGGLAFGLGCASKWTVIYSGAALAVCYFGALWLRYKQLCTGPNALAARGGKGSGAAAFRSELVCALAGGVLFYVVVPLVIYLLSYWPYKLHDPAYGLADWWNAQLHMYNYHSKLDATHSFASPWYTWFLNLRPVWYYMGSGLESGTVASIAGFFNPVVCWLGAAAVLAVMAKGLVGKANAAQRGVLVFFLASLLPWLLVTRCTFLYHFFPCLPFMILALALCLQQHEADAPVLTRRVSVGILAAAAVLFVWFYPALSGLPVSTGWAASLKWLPSWGFYIL